MEAKDSSMQDQLGLCAADTTVRRFRSFDAKGCSLPNGQSANCHPERSRGTLSSCAPWRMRLERASYFVQGPSTVQRIRFANPLLRPR